jgi:hypothetical protein
MSGCAGARGAGRRPLRRVSTRPARLALAFVLSLIFAVAWSEEAHAVSDTEHFRFASGICLKERSMTYVWPRDGVLYGQSVTRPFSSDCSTSVSKPAGHLWGQVYVEKWNPFLGEYRPCASTQWYNANRTSRHAVWGWLGPQFHRWCGSGWYRTWSQGSVWHNGAWRTTPWVQSGYDFFY